MLMFLSLRKMKARVLPYLSMPKDWTWTDLFWAIFVKKSFASWKSGMFFSGVLMPMSLRVAPFVSSIVSPSITRATWKIWRSAVASVRP